VAALPPQTTASPSHAPVSFSSQTPLARAPTQSSPPVSTTPSATNLVKAPITAVTQPTNTLLSQGTAPLTNQSQPDFECQPPSKQHPIEESTVITQTDQNTSSLHQKSLEMVNEEAKIHKYAN
jgi:hypothetical protein